MYPLDGSTQTVARFVLRRMWDRHPPKLAAGVARAEFRSLAFTGMGQGGLFPDGYCRSVPAAPDARLAAPGETASVTEKAAQTGL